MITYYCKICGNAVELSNAVSEVPWCRNPKCNNGMATMMEVAHGNEIYRVFPKHEEERKRRVKR